MNPAQNLQIQPMRQTLRQWRTMQPQPADMNLRTRAQIVTFLYRMLGNGETPSGPCPFSDVPQSSYYYNAVNWAYSHSITTGTSASTFSPDKPCTRAQIVTFLYNCLGKRQASSASAFQDVAQGDDISAHKPRPDKSRAGFVRPPEDAFF